MSNEINQNALVTKMGDVYHYYISMELLISTNDWFKCHIEKYGDIVLEDSNGNHLRNIEVKHHVSTKELKVYDEEFQKTLYNWYNIRKYINDSTKLELLTSSIISEENPLFHWNAYDKEKKYKTIIGNQKKSNGEYYSNISKYFFNINKNPEELKSILEKVNITHSMLSISEIKNHIKENTYFRIFNSKNKQDEVINSLYGLIANGLKDKERWEITKKEFDQKLNELSTLAQDKILRTDDDVTIDEADMSIKTYREKQFIKKLENIEFEEDVLQLAIDDYAKTIIEASNRLDLTKSIEYHNRLENYENSLVRRVDDIKTKHKYKSDTDIVKSQNSYFEVMDSNKIPFMPQEFDDQTTFFQKGYFHVLADDEEKPHQICWSLKPEDLL